MECPSWLFSFVIHYYIHIHLKFINLKWTGPSGVTESLLRGGGGSDLHLRGGGGGHDVTPLTGPKTSKTSSILN